MPSIAPEWMPQNSELEQFYIGVKKFVKCCVEPLKKEDIKYLKEKSIVDPVVGYIHLNTWEMALIDTEILQRLRKIKQLGLADCVFPTLGYSRFEHTLGVVGRLAQILNKLIENQKRINKEDQFFLSTINKYEIPIRLAALFHDTGHCLFSHASERVINDLNVNNNYPSTKTIQEIFTDHFEKTSNISIAEILSVTILSTEEMHAFIDSLEIPGKTSDVIDNWCECAARFIFGLPIKKDPSSLFLAQLMSSGLDIDKLDYMTREAHFSGIKLEIDIERLYDKMRIFKISYAKLPDGLKTFNKYFEVRGDRAIEFYVLGMDLGGQFAFEEFCISRVTLYDKIYLHQKIRAAESQLIDYLKQIPIKYAEMNEVHRWLFIPESIVEYPNMQVPTIDTQKGTLFEKVCDFKDFNLINIDKRKLLYRAYAFGPANSLSDPTIDKNIIDLPSLQVISNIDSDLQTFKRELMEEANNILTSLEKTETIKEEDIIIDMPRYLNVQQGHNTLYFEKPVRLPLRWTMPIDRIVDYYQKNRALAYIFTQRQYCSILLLASEIVIWRKYRSNFEQESLISKKIVEKAEEIKKKLNRKNYYKNATILKPVPAYLVTPMAQDIIQKVSIKLSQFESFSHQRLTVSHITNYLSQFPDELQQAATKFIDHIELIDNSILITGFEKRCSKLNADGIKNIALLPLGGVYDSAHHLLYYLREITKTSGNIIPDIGVLNDETVMSADHILFFDDNANTGLQIINIFSSWLGKPIKEELQLKEEHVHKLGQEASVKLLQTDISIILGIGTEHVDKTIVDLMKNELGFNEGKVKVYIEKLLPIDKRIFSGKNSAFDEADKNKLYKFLYTVGHELMKNEGKSDDSAKEKALGYHSAEAMIIFPYNVPTMTITPLWCSGKFKENEWMPLVERRRRRNAMTKEIIGEDT